MCGFMGGSERSREAAAVQQGVRRTGSGQPGREGAGPVDAVHAGQGDGLAADPPSPDHHDYCRQGAPAEATGADQHRSPGLARGGPQRFDPGLGATRLAQCAATTTGADSDDWAAWISSGLIHGAPRFWLDVWLDVMPRAGLRRARGRTRRPGLTTNPGRG